MASSLKKAIFYSQSSDLVLHLRELLRTLGWDILDPVKDFDDLIITLKSQDIGLIIIDDSIELPSPLIIRLFMQKPLTRLIPCIAFVLDEHSAEVRFLRTLLEVEFVPKPLTPTSFIPAFLKITKKWEQPAYLALKKGVMQWRAGDDRVLINVLIKLLNVPAIVSYVEACLGIAYETVGDIVTAEKILLESLKKNPKNPNFMLTLADLYLRNAMPSLAARLYYGTHKMFPQFLTTLPDLIESEIMKKNYLSALELVDLCIKKKFCLEQMGWFKASLFMIIGQKNKALISLEKNPEFQNRFKTLWTDHEENV